MSESALATDSIKAKGKELTVALWGAQLLVAGMVRIYRPADARLSDRKGHTYRIVKAKYY